ncbi:MAG: hypothetical protein HRF50_08635 [Phycisphaerae bacterium]
MEPDVGMAGQSNVTLPTLVSLILCDQIIDDRLTGKKSAIGLFNTIWLTSAPARIQAIAVMASLTEITGRIPLELRLVRDADNATLMGSRGVLEAPSPLAVVDLVFVMQGIPLATAGQYAFELYARGEMLGRRRFHALVGRAPPASGPPIPPVVSPDQPDEPA